MWWQLNPKERLGYVIFAALAAAIIAVLGYRASAKGAEQVELPHTTKQTKREEPTKALTAIVVHVVGAVKNPGVYHLKAGARAEDAVHAAGGLAPGASAESVNLAAVLTDGEQLRVPTKAEAITAPVAAVPATTGKSGKLTSGLISLNSASAQDLQRVPGIGPATAQKVIEYRTAHGGFTAVDQIKSVGGIGEKKFAKMANFLKL